MERTSVAVDLGATSGRVIVGRLTAGPSPRVHLEQVARFVNDPLATPAGLQWDLDTLLGNIRTGIRAAAESSRIASIGVDSWGVDYALLTGGSHSTPFHYRDARTAGGVSRTHDIIAFEELYSRNGLQFMPFNTLYQLATDDPAALSGAEHLLFFPDLIGYLLSGAVSTERTIASTSGLLDLTGQWDLELITRLGLPERIFGPLVNPGEVKGHTSERLLPGAGGVPLLAVGSHDTASAVAAVPMAPEHAAYISCGTWGLVGLETPAPIATVAAREAEFTNEGGVDGRNRFHHNVMGLWLLNESIRTWNASLPESQQWRLEELLASAGALTPPPSGWIFDTNDPVFMPPGDMPGRIHDWFDERGIQPPRTPAQTVRSIIESLAAVFARAVHTGAELSGQQVKTIHIVGGGALNELLCQRTADHAGIPVVAGPIEATALGNILVQARTHGWVGEGLTAIRRVVADSFPVTTYEPGSTAR